MARKMSKKKNEQEPERRRKARKRRENARERQRVAALHGLPEIPAPLATIRVFPRPLKTGNSDVVMPILMDIRAKKHVEGQYKMTAPVKHLSVALGVHTLLAYHALVVLLGTGVRAKEALRQLRGGPGDIDYRLVIGRKHLASRTAFESEDEVKRWATNKYAPVLAVEAAPDEAAMQPLIEAETEAVRLVFRAYEHAQRALVARNDAMTMKDSEAATALLEQAFTHPSTQLTVAQALQVAMFADINPAGLWLQFGMIYDPTFEFARFVGRVNAGVEAMLKHDQFALAKRLLATKPEDAGLSGLWIALKEALGRHFSTAQFDLAIHLAEATTGVIRVSRSTRELWVEAPTGGRHLITRIDARDDGNAGAG